MQVKISPGFLLALALMGCSASGVDRNVSEAMSRYFSTKQAVYADPQAGTLSRVATTNEVQNFFPLVQALRASGSVMKTEMEYKIERSELARSGATATVQTRECWKYWWEDRNSGQITKDLKVENYCLEYSLVKGDCGIWKVDRVRRLERL